MGLIEFSINETVEKRLQPKIENSIEKKLFDLILNEISQTEDILNYERSCFIIGFGSQPKTVYDELEKIEGINVVWNAFLGPKWLKILLFFVAGNMGLVEVFDKNKIPQVFDLLSRKSMAGLFSFNKIFKEDFISTIKSGKWKSKTTPILKNDKEAFVLLLDGDSPLSKTGYRVIVFYNNNCPINLIRIAEKFKW